MADVLDVELFETQRSHLWRTTLRSFYAGKVPDQVVSTQFGHSTEVAQLYYTDVRDISDLTAAAQLDG